MLVSTYDTFVQETDQTSSLPAAERLDIAAYGLASEIGSVVAAVKKRLLARGESVAWNEPNPEIVEELGDVLWYCFALAHAASEKRINILAHDISSLRKEIGSETDRAKKIARVLLPEKRSEFLDAAKAFPRKSKTMTFEDYQKLAFLTARTQDRTLAQVCLAVLWQLSAQLLRRNLPAIELDLNRALGEKSLKDTLGEITWHVSALSSIYGLKLSDVAETNVDKVSRRWDRSTVTPLHDDRFPAGEQIPRKFEIAFVSIAPNRLRMYLDGKPLGDDLTDNAYEDDGYRYHDIMHLANAAKLGWSPVLRSLLGRKRKSVPEVDEVEDGARARIVEEAVIKAIHTEGERTSALRGNTASAGPVRLFGSRGDLSFSFLKLVTGFVTDLEVKANRFWEWEEAIIEGFDIFHRLRCEGQGTVAVDLGRRALTFDPHVFLELNGRVAGLGSARVRAGSSQAALGGGLEEPERVAAQKLAAFDALGLAPDAEHLWNDLQIAEGPGGTLAVKAYGSVRKAMWARRAVTFRLTVTESDGEAHATALAIADH